MFAGMKKSPFSVSATFLIAWAERRGSMWLQFHDVDDLMRFALRRSPVIDPRSLWVSIPCSVALYSTEMKRKKSYFESENSWF